MSLNHLVTVFCTRDWAQFCLQVESLRFVVKPITHWVIVNEADDLSLYSHKIRQLYTLLPHRVIVVARPKTVSTVGWDNQQYYKLWIWREIQNAYVILDCKNFFVQACSLDDFARLQGPDNTNNYVKEGNTFRPALHYYSQQLGLAVQPRHLGCQTPFVISPEVMRHLDLDLFEQSFSVITPSEFLYYSLWMQRLGLKIKISGQPWARTIWPYETLEQFQQETLIPYKIFALHRLWLDRGPDRVAAVNQWLAQLGFRSRL